MALTKVKAGNILLTTPSASSNDVTPATTQYVTTALANMVDSAPSTLNTLNELAAALGDDANYATTTTNAIAAKAPLASPTLTGNPKINVGTNKNIIFSGGIGEIGSVPGFQAINDAASANTDFGIRATTIRFATGSDERMRIDSSGNVGINTSSPTSYANSQAALVIQDTSSPAIVWSDTGQARDWFAVAQGSGLYFNYADGGGSGGASNVTDVLVLDSSGNVGIGTNSFTSNSVIKELVVKGTATNGVASYTLTTSDNSLGGGMRLTSFNDTNALVFGMQTSYNETDTSPPTERMRINSSGLVDIGVSYTANAHAPVLRLSGMSTSAYSGGLEFYSGYGPKATAEIHSTASGSQGGEFWINVRSQGGNAMSRVLAVNNSGRLRLTGCSEANSGALNIMGEVGNSYDAIQFYHNSTTVVGRIRTAASSTSYITSSDYRLKENIDYTWDATTRLKQLKPTRFNWIADDTNTLVDGFLAHEVSSVVPEAITGTKDEVDSDGQPVLQGIDHSKLVPLLVKTIQEQQTIIEDLKSRIETLEG